VDLRSLPSVKSFLLPGGVLLLGTAILLHTDLLKLTSPAVDSYYAACFGAGIVLAWRFHSSRVALTLATLFLAERALVFFSSGHALASVTGRTAFALLALLLPVNFVLFSLLAERGFTAPDLVTRLFLLFIQSVIVAAMCRPDVKSDAEWLHVSFLNQKWVTWTKLPQIALSGLFLALAILFIRFLSYRKPVESGFFWSLLATSAALQFGGVGKISTAYLGTAALILLASVIETSYLMAYHDELTGVPARRAFNDAILALEAPYAIALVDIDHFKKFNDTYGHDTGDHVLRLVAARLSRVTGGGKAYRCGGEEFSIIFTGLTAREAAPHLESLRESVERSPFRVRTQPDRRSTPRGPDRRRTRSLKKPEKTRLLETMDPEVRVTVSIGVAEPTTRDEDVNHVIKTADQALYCAKANGRNRIEISPKAKRSPSVMSREHVS
jgi:diguanylate cyclase (GGDEF)-like protein